MNPYLILAALSASLLAVACASQTSNSTNRDAEFLRAQLDEDWDYWMAQYPEAATSVGYPGQDMRWTDYSAQAIADREDYLKKSAGRLAAIDRARLSAEDQVHYDLYRDLLEVAVLGLEFRHDAMPMKGVIPRNLLMPMNQLEGVQQDIQRTLAIMPAETAEDYENIVLRLEGVGTLMDQMISLMEQGMAAGVTPPKITFRDVPDQVKSQIHEDPLQSPLLAAFRKPAAPAAARERAIQAYERVVAPAFTRLHDFLVTRYLPNCREDISATALKNGSEMYAYNVRWHTTMDKTPREIHELGQAEVKRIRALMDEVMAAAGFKGSYDEFKAFLRTAPHFYFNDAESLVTAYRDIAKRADPELARLFGRLPQNPYGVKVVPDSIAPSQTTAYYEVGSFAAGRAGYMFANTYRLDARPRWEMEALTLHEAVPGHHLQISIAQEIEGLPEFRKHSSYTAFAEGWALYAESLGEEMGFYQDAYSKFGQLTYEMWRAVRLVVDTGLHSMGWTRDQAIDFFRQNAAKTDQDITVEVDRYIVWPGQALGYKMGQLKIRELRRKAEEELGNRFDIRQFHDAVLGRGALPMNVLEDQINAWTAKVGGRNPR